MKYAIALATLLSAASFAQEIPELSFEGVGAIEELAAPFAEKCSAFAQDIKANATELFIKYNPFNNDTAHAAVEMTNQTSFAQKNNVISAVSASMSLNNSPELSLFTTVKSYIVNRYTAITAVVLAVGSGAFYYSKNK